MSKKWSVFGLYLLSFLVPLNIYSQPNQLDTCYMPLAVGNKWVYFEDNMVYHPIYFGNTFDVPNKGLSIIEITKSKVVNNKTYYFFNNSWVRYDKEEKKAYTLISNEVLYMDFKATSGQTYSGSLGEGQTRLYEVDILGENYPGTGVEVGTLLYHGILTNYAFVNNYGLAYQKIAGVGPNSVGVITNSHLIGFYSADSTLGISFQDSAHAIISNPKFKLSAQGKIDFYVEIDHKYSIETIHNYNGSLHIAQGVSFINTAYIDYFCYKGNDTISFPQILLSDSTETKFKTNFEFPLELLAKGYKFKYKIVAKDKSPVPIYSYYPKSGYTEMEIDFGKTFAFYPFENNNLWIYRKKNDAIGINELVKLSIDGDTVLSNGLKYKIFNFNGEKSFERLDSAAGIVYSVSNINNGEIDEVPKWILTLPLHSTFYSNNIKMQDSITYSNNINSMLFGIETNERTYTKGKYPQAIFKLNVNIGLTYLYMLEKFDGIPFFIDYKIEAAKINGVVFGDSTLIIQFEDELKPTVEAFSLSQNYPNPFNPNTTIQYSIPESGNVELKVFDVLGREVKTLINGNVEAGNHSVNFNASNLSSGVYFYSIKYAGKNTITKKMLLTK